MSSKTPEKTAVIAIGRWEPPHRGHEVLIRDTVQRAKDEGGDPFVWTSPTDTDPLSVAQKIYYLQRMYPKRLYNNLTFLTDYPALGLSAAYKKELRTGRCRMTTRGAEKRLPENWSGMDICQKYKYKNIVNDKLLSRVRLVRDRAAGVSPGDDKLPSKQCLNWLKSDAGGNYAKVILLVGSDRVEAFKQYNQELGDDLFTEFSIEQSGAERGATGRQELSVVSNLDSDAELEKLSKLMSELSFEEREGSSKISLPEKEKEFRAEEYSGTKTRQYAREGNGESFMHAVYLDKSDMTYLDCFCMMNDIRVGSGMTAFPLSLWSQDVVPLISQQKRILQAQINSIDDWERSITMGSDDDDEDDKYMEQFAHIGPKSRRRRKKRRGGRKTKRKRKKKKKKTRRKKRKIKTRRRQRRTRKN